MSHLSMLVRMLLLTCVQNDAGTSTCSVCRGIRRSLTELTACCLILRRQALAWAHVQIQGCGVRLQY